MALETFTLLEAVLQLNARVVLPEAYNPGTNAAGRTTRINNWGTRKRLLASASPSPAPVAILAQELTIAGGEATIDLTAAKIVGATSGGAVASTEDLTGKNLIGWLLSTEGYENAAKIVAKPHATNGYDLFGVDGASKGFLDVPPDAVKAGILATASRDPVAAGDKIIHFTGTDDDQIAVILIFEA